MRKHIRHLAFGVSSLALIIFVFGSYVIVAQTVLTGTWTAKTKTEKPDKIYLSFSRESSKGGHHQHSSDFSYSDLQGLTRDQANGKVNFRMAREAGTIECEGTFTDGRGSGTFRFTANQAFIDAMQSRGYNFQDEQLFSATTLNVTTAVADDLKGANFGPLGVEDLFKAVIFKVTPQFMAEMKATGFPNMGMEELVKARIFEIDANYVRQVNEMGFKSNDFEELVKFRIFKVTPEFLAELRSEGFTNISAEDVVQCRIFKIDGDFIRKAKAEDPNVTIKDLVEMKIGVRRK
jgi:hypothetical protein